MNAKDQILVRKTLAGDSEAFGGSLIYEVQAEQARQGVGAELQSGPFPVRLEGAAFAADAGEALRQVYLPGAAARRFPASF